VGWYEDLKYFNSNHWDSHALANCIGQNIALLGVAKHPIGWKFYYFNILGIGRTG
jgi:hypothetical protein